MRCILLQKVRLRMGSRLLWAALISEREGVSLLFVKKPDENWQDMLLLATENVRERCYEPVHASRFELAEGDLSSIGGILQAIGEGEAQAFFKPAPEDLF